MPVTRSNKGNQRESSSSEETSESRTRTPSTSESEGSNETAVPTADAAVSPMPRPATPPPAVATPAAAALRTKNVASDLQRKEKERIRLRLQLLELEIAELREKANEENEETSRITEADVTERVQNWVNESTPLLALRNVPHSAASPEAPAVPVVPVVPEHATDANNNAAPAVSAAPPAPVSAAVPAVANPSSTPPAVRNTPEEKKEDPLMKIAEVIARMEERSNRPQCPELPVFTGDVNDWLAFYSAYQETQHLLSPMDNKLRLRRSIKGRAFNAVKSLMICAESTAEEIMNTLQWSFGNAAGIVDEELDRLRKLPKATEDPRDIHALALNVTNAVTSLQALGDPQALCSNEIARAIVKKLPPTLRNTWCLQSENVPQDRPPLLAISDFLKRYMKLNASIMDKKNEDSKFVRKQRTHTTRERDDSSCEREGRSPARPHYAKKQQYAPKGTAREKERDSCNVCNEDHSAKDCKKFLQADTDGRWDLAKKHRLCFRCLRPMKKSHHCKMTRCGENGCPGRHHRLLHRMKKETEKSEDTKEEAEAVTTTWTDQRRAKAYLKMIPVRVSASAGEVNTWALLDDGSTVTLIDSELAAEVGARGPVDPLKIEAITEKSMDASRSRRVSITLRRDDAAVKISARTISNMKLSPQAVKDNDIEGCRHLEDIKEDLKYTNALPRILIGQDNWHLLMAKKVKKGRRDQPVASLTPLGWVLHGARTRTLGKKVDYVNTVTVEDSMDEQLRQHFAIENLKIEPKRPASDPEQRALRILEESAVQRADGHYEVALLWKHEGVTMPDNYENTERRLLAVERKLEKQPALKEKYEEQMRALIDKGYAEPAPAEKKPGKVWYLPHFGVVNPMKPDKLRVVHDAAARTGGTSLNDRLLPGPDLLQSLPGVLMRFRQHRVAVSADIAEMFMQVKIREEDREFLRYIWRGNEYRMTSLIFGATCSPSAAIFVKNKNAAQYEETHPEAAAAIIRNHYMDDYLDSFETEAEAARIADEVRSIHRSAKFELRKWVSNSREVREQLIGEEGSSTEAKKLSDGATSERVLGLVWKPESDELAFNLDLARIPKEMLARASPTKREALKIVMSLYDPMGLAAPVVIKAKQLLQEVWRRGTGWDEKIDSDLAEQWREWMVHLEKLRHVSVPRCYLQYSDAAVLQLHTFVDASESAYAAAVYWRAVAPDGRVTLTLVMAKAKVAPLKLTSIPRLELQAAVMGSRMAAAVIEEHDRKPDSKVFWTDSKTVLTWVKTGSRSYKPFVAHRIAAIEENSAVHEWRWVPTKENVADDATRDVPQDFGSEHRWYSGARFLLEDEGQWPQERVKNVEPTGEEKCTYTRSTEKVKINECVPDPNNISKWLIYVRATARVLQFIELCKQKREGVHYRRTKKNKTTDENWKQSPIRKANKKAIPYRGREQRKFIELNNELLRRAELLVIRAIQETCFGEEIEDLKKEKTVSRNSRLYPLATTYEENIIRLKSRISAVEEATIERAPPILDGNDRRVRLYVEHVHKRLAHAGAETTINECRQHYWVLRLRPVARKLINECLLCRIRRAQPPSPSTGNHPPSRLAHHQRPFTFTGLDYFGPLTVTVGRTLQKRYVAIFTCLTTRAVHLEMAASLSTDSAVMALRRMIARRGCPTEIWSDNGTNLHGADKELRRAMDEATLEEAEKRTISWRFIPPGAPFMGGAWERLVRSVKTALAATQQSRHPTEEVLTTLLAEAEYIVNSRPLTHVSVNHEDEEALTPNHFLLGGSALTPAPGTFEDGDLIGRASWRASQRLADMFWARWLREYLPELQYRREPHGRGPALKTGDVVLIVDNTLPRNTWPRGVVTATYPGADGVVRAADVRTKGGTLRRPTKKLVIIPTEEQRASPSPSVDCTDVRVDGARREKCSGQPVK